MRGMIINLWDGELPQDSPWRTREEWRENHPVLFEVPDHEGVKFPVFEVWFWHSEFRRWFVMSRLTDPRLAAEGVIYFCEMGQLAAWMRYLQTEQPRAG